MLRKNVSISDLHLKMLDPLLKKHEGNLSAAMRDIIDFTGFVTENMGSLETAKDLFKERNHAIEETRSRIYGVTIPLTMFRWLLSCRKCELPPLHEAIQLFQPHNVNIYDLKSLSKVMNEEISYLNWPVSVYIGYEGEHVSIQITGIVPEINSFYANLIAMFLANNRNPLKIINMMQYPASIYMTFSEASDRDEAARSIFETFCENGVRANKIAWESDPVMVTA